MLQSNLDAYGVKCLSQGHGHDKYLSIPYVTSTWDQIYNIYSSRLQSLPVSVLVLFHTFEFVNNLSLSLFSTVLPHHILISVMPIQNSPAALHYGIPDVLMFPNPCLQVRAGRLTQRPHSAAHTPCHCLGSCVILDAAYPEGVMKRIILLFFLIPKSSQQRDFFCNTSTKQQREKAPTELF